MRNFIAFLLIVLSAVGCSTIEDQPQIVAVDVYFNDGTMRSYNVIDCRAEGYDIDQVLADLQMWAYDDLSVSDMIIEVNGRRVWSFKGYD